MPARKALPKWLRERIAALRGARPLADLHDLSCVPHAARLALPPARSLVQDSPAPPLALALLAALALPAVHSAHADTNAYGDELIILDDAAGYGNAPLAFSYEITDAQPLPLGEDGEVDLLERIRAGYALPELNSPHTRKHENWYASRPDYVRRMMDRSQKYLYHIVEEVEKRGMPSEIALLPMIESAFNPQAYSRSHAAGIWQFIPSTGRSFGLKQNWWVDKRRDVLAATDAALTYLQKLHVMFGSWELALAAYNAGEGTVMRAIERNRKRGLPTDYQSLELPVETREYVPKLLAAKNIVSHPERYGLDIPPIANAPYFTTVSAPEQIDAHVAAKLAGISLEEFLSLNPKYNRPLLTATGKGRHEILLPMGAEVTFAENLASYDRPLVSWQTYQARRGERLDGIARKFGIGVDRLREINDLPAMASLDAPRQLLVPRRGETGPVTPVATETARAPVAEPAGGTLRHVVNRGDTLSSIARRYGTTTRALIAANQLKSHRLQPGQTLLLEHAAPGGPVVAKAPARLHYVVRKGDTLSTIARKFDVAVNDIRRWNNLRSSHIVPGDRLTILTVDAA